MLIASRLVDITNTLGLHLRAAAEFVSLAQQFRADASVICDGRKVSGKSILDLTAIAAARGSRPALDADGPDAEAALDAPTGLVGRGLDEEE